MPLKLNVGVSKKVGLPDYGSLGTSCNAEVEVDGRLIFDDLDRFHRHVQQAYVACAQAVNDELARLQAGEHSPSCCATNGNGRRSGANEHQNGYGCGASRKQLDYIKQLAGQITGLGVRRLDTLAARMFDKPLADLSGLDASSLIDTLKSIKAGQLDLNAALNGASA